MIRTAVFSSATLFLAACGGSPEAAEETRAEQHEPDMAETRLYQPETEVTHGAAEVEIRASWMRPHPQGRDVTAAYVVVRLAAGEEDLLTAARIDGADRVEMHGHSISSDGAMRMEAIPPQRVGSEGPLVFTPGGRHLMVFGLAPVSEGDTVTGTLVFQNAGEVPVTFAVRNMPPGMPTEY